MDAARDCVVLAPAKEVVLDQLPLLLLGQLFLLLNHALVVSMVHGLVLIILSIYCLRTGLGLRDIGVASLFAAIAADDFHLINFVINVLNILLNVLLRLVLRVNIVQKLGLGWQILVAFLLVYQAQLLLHRLG